MTSPEAVNPDAPATSPRIRPPVEVIAHAIATYDLHYPWTATEVAEFVLADLAEEGYIQIEVPGVTMDELRELIRERYKEPS